MFFRPTIKNILHNVKIRNKCDKFNRKRTFFLFIEKHLFIISFYYLFIIVLNVSFGSEFINHLVSDLSSATFAKTLLLLYVNTVITISL